MKPDATLIEEYRQAWAEFDQTLRRFQNAPDRPEELFVAVEAARLKYSAARDQLVARTLNTDVSHLAPVSEQSKIRSSARLLWEISGRPGDSAESDWLQAEALVRGAS